MTGSAGPWSIAFASMARTACSSRFSPSLGPITRTTESGPIRLQSAQSRYGELRIDGGALVDFPLWRSSRVDAGLGVRSATFRDGHFGGDPGILQNVAADVYPLPDGFARGYTVEYNDVRLALDSRRKFPRGGLGSPPRGAGRTGQRPPVAELGVDPLRGGRRRVLGRQRRPPGHQPLRARHVFGPAGADARARSRSSSRWAATCPARSCSPLRCPGSSRDGSSIEAAPSRRSATSGRSGHGSSGSLQGAVGNVFGEHLEGFDTRLLRASGAFGIESDSSPDSSFELLFGIGTETFAHGGQVDSLRLAVGLTRF